MKMRAALVAAALSAATLAPVAHADKAEPAPTPTATATATPSPVAAATETVTATETATETATSTKTSTKTTSTSETTSTEPRPFDPTKGLWDNNDASSKTAPKEPFSEQSSGLNRLAAYLNSNQFKTISLVVTLLGSVVTVGSQILALMVTVNPGANDRLKAALDRLMP